MTHQYPIGSLVENTESGIRLFVLKHTRDSDGEPTYTLSYLRTGGFLPSGVLEREIKRNLPEAFYQGYQCGKRAGALMRGVSEKSLALIKTFF